MPTTSTALATDSPLTAAAAARMARQGGNVVDIAVAASLAATVCEPLMCSLGGSGFFMVKLAGQPPELIEGADVVPSLNRAATVESDAWRTVHVPYGDGIEVIAGHASIAVPGMLAAAELAWQRHGCLPWADVVAPALELARSEVPVSPTLGKWLAMSGHALFAHQAASRRCFFSADHKPLKHGDRLHLPGLDDALEQVAAEGSSAFYKGELGRLFVDEICEHGGFVTQQDLASYQPVIRRPLRIQSQAFELALNPAPAVGGAAVGYLIQLIESNWEKANASPAQRVALNAWAQTKLAGARGQIMSSAEFNDQIANHLLKQAALQSPHALRSPNTTHLSVVTSDGGMAAVTLSMGYGAGVTVPELGIACNNSLGEPELNPQGFHAAPRGMRLVSNMAPTLAWNVDGRCLSIGSPGASRITSAIAQTWIRIALENMSPEQAVQAPRIHIETDKGDCLAQYEPGLDVSLLDDALTIRPFDEPNMYFGAPKIAGLGSGRQLLAVADNRREGAIEIVRAP